MILGVVDAVCYVSDLVIAGLMLGPEEIAAAELGYTIVSIGNLISPIA